MLLINAGTERVDMSAVRPGASGNLWGCEAAEFIDIRESGEGGDGGTAEER